MSLAVKVKSILDRDIYLLERTKLKALDGTTDKSIILSAGTDVLYYNQVNDCWEKGIILAYNSYGYAKVRWKLRGNIDEYVNWFEAANVSTTPPEGIPRKFASAKPARVFDFSDTPLDDSGNEEDIGSPLVYKKSSSKRPLDFSPKTKAPAGPKLFAKMRSKKVVSPTSKQPLIGKTKKKSANSAVEDLTVEQLDPQYNPLPPRFAGIPPKSMAAAAPLYYPYPMYVPVPVLVPQYPARPPSISYPFFPAQNFEDNFTRRTESGGIPPRKGLPLFRIVPKQQSRLLTKQPFSYTGEKLTSYQAKSIDSSRKYALLSSHNTKAYKKPRENKKYIKLSSTSDSSSEEEEKRSQSSLQPETTSSPPMKHLQPGSGSSTKVRRRASTELNRSFILEKKLSDLPSSSPTIKESGIPIITVTESTVAETVKYDMIREENDLLSGRAHIISTDSGVRTDTSNHPIESVATTTEDELPSSSLLQDKPTTDIVIQDATDKGQSESGETLLTSDSKLTFDSKFNPSHASVEHYLFGSQHFSEVERATTFPRGAKLSRHGSAEDLRSKTLTSLGTTLSRSTDLLGDLGTCRSKRRLMYAGNSESEFKPGSSDSVSNDESEILHTRPTGRFNKRLSIAMEVPEDSIPGTPKTSDPLESPTLQSSTNRMSTFLKNFSPARLMSFKPKKRVTFKP